MPKHGKKYVEASKQVEKGTLYEVNDAIALVKKTAAAKFDETVEVAFRLGVDPRQSDKQSRAQLYCRTELGKAIPY